jgi:fructose-bisphosphate aldolase class II
MRTLKEVIYDAKQKNIAVGHFNACTLDQILAIADGALELGVPVIVGVSEGEREYTGVITVANIIRSIRESRNQEIYLNADHTYSFEKVKEAIDAGFDSVIFDGAKLSLEQNIIETKRCVDYAKSIDHEVLVEGEIGFIGSSSKVLDSIPDGAVVNDSNMTTFNDASRFVSETHVDMLAPAVGNIHGIVKSGEPRLNTDRILELSKVGIPLVLHGASGNSKQDISKSIKNGMSVVHINTELRLAYKEALLQSLNKNADEVAAYKYMNPAKSAMKDLVIQKLRLFSKPDEL